MDITGEHEVNDLWGKDDAEKGHKGHNNGQQSETYVGQISRLLLPLPGKTLGKGRHECRSQRTFGKEATEHIGYLKGGEESVGGETRPEQARYDHVPHHSYDPRQDSCEAQYPGGPDDIFLLRHELPFNSGQRKSFSLITNYRSRVSGHCYTGEVFTTVEWKLVDFFRIVTNIPHESSFANILIDLC